MRPVHLTVRPALVGVIVALACCARSAEPNPRRLEHVVATIPPLAGLVRPLLPETIEVVSLIEPGQGIHGHRLNAAQLARARTADVIFAVGLGIEESTLPNLVQNKPEGQQIAIFADMLGIQDGHADNDHDHAHSNGVDPHLWLDPDLAAQFVMRASELLIDRAGAGSDKGSAIADRRDRWLSRIAEIDRAYASALEPYRGSAVLTQHPAFGRLLERYGLHERPLQAVSAAAGPSAGEVAEAVRAASAQGVVAVFLEPQSSAELMQRIASRSGLPVETLDPLGYGDWEQLMRSNLDALVRALEAGARRP